MFRRFMQAARTARTLTRHREHSTATFDASYQDNAHLQRKFNQDAIENFAKRIAIHTHTQREKPLQILDLCCGHGEPTHELLHALDNYQRKAHITGRDISAEQIEIAQANYGHNPQLQLEVQDVADMNDVAQYDAVVSWFGFHWIEDKTALAEKIATALKPGGQVLFLIPLDKVDQHSYRHRVWEQLKQTTPELQDSVELTLFHPEPQLYLKAFYQAGFFALNTALFTHTFTYPIAQYMSYLSSWAPEVRALKEAGIDPTDYLREVIAQHPTAERIAPEKSLANSLNGQSVFYQEKLLQYEASVPAC